VIPPVRGSPILEIPLGRISAGYFGNSEEILEPGEDIENRIGRFIAHGVVESQLQFGIRVAPTVVPLTARVLNGNTIRFAN
jgi:hypothetical protein